MHSLLAGGDFSVTGGYTMDTISSTAFGVQLDSQNDQSHPMLINGKRVMGTHRESSFRNRITAVLRVAMFRTY